MTALTEPRHRYTYGEYLAYEQDAAMKHEFVDGEILAMAGGSPRHSAIAMNVGVAIRLGRPAGCNVFQSDLKVRVLATGRARYPDVSMICGPVELDPADPYRQTITNPTLLVEVLSPSTEDVDRVSKRRDYQLIPSLREYVLVSQYERRVEVYRRQSSGGWDYIDVRDGIVKLATGPTLDLAQLYSDLPEE
jgi:Uma2 family endonuclease